jgi:hypothetical protein
MLRLRRVMDRVALVIEDITPVNAVVIAEGKAGDDWLKANPNAVEVTGLNPPPGLGNGWTYVKGAWVAPVPPVPTVEEVEAARRQAYQTDSDPLFFGWQRGENTEQEWLSAVQAVKDAHPYPETV